MEIYVVRSGDTIRSIALNYGMTVEQLIISNGIKEPYQLAIGQTLVIAHPERVYTVNEGDTLAGIAEVSQVDIMQLLRNNPQLAGRQYIYPGETLVISYPSNIGSLLVAGYTYPYIREEILLRTLPDLTYLLIFNYRITEGGVIVGGDEDVAVIKTAGLYHTGTTLVVTAYSEIGVINTEVVYELLHNEQIQAQMINKILTEIKEKGYSGANLAFQLISEANQQLYLDFLRKVFNSLHAEGYSVFLTLNPGLKFSDDKITFEKLNYSELSKNCDGILFLSYDWGSVERPPIQYSIVTTKPLLDYIIAQVPLEKIRVELPTLGYDWPLPYVEGKTKANALNFDSVLALAAQMNAVIQYDEESLSAYFQYVDSIERQHIVWFKDARSIDSALKILQSNGIKGVGIWNIMFYFNQMRLVMNTQYQIEKTI